LTYAFAHLGSIYKNDLFAEIKNYFSIDFAIDKSLKHAWGSTPDGLKFTINKYLEKYFYDLYSSDDLSKEGEDLTRRMIWDVYNKIPCIALVAEESLGDHWVVVEGYQTSADPRGPEDYSYQIIAISVLDPLSFQVYNSIRLLPNLRNIPYYPSNTSLVAWTNGFFGVCNASGTAAYSSWFGKYLAICRDPAL
jgi:hypothetical protein